MTQYKTLSVKLSNSQLNKLKSWKKKKNGTEVTSNPLPNTIGDDVTYFMANIQKQPLWCVIKFKEL